jgi:two-component system chemotaxis response regulator CheY
MTASILTVDDSPSIRVALKIALTNAGYSVAEAGNGAEGSRRPTPATSS